MPSDTSGYHPETSASAGGLD